MFKKVIVVSALLSTLLVTEAFSSSWICDLTSFCEIHGYRSAMYMRDHPGTDITLYDANNALLSFSQIYAGKNRLCVQAPAGSLYVNMNDLTIEKAVFELADYTDYDREETNDQLLSCIISFSALEYSMYDEQIIKIAPEIYNNSATILDEAFRIWNDEIGSDLADSISKALKDVDAMVFLYHGTYDYYITCNMIPVTKDGDPHQRVRLIAQWPTITE